LNVLSLEKQLALIATGFAKSSPKDCFRWAGGFFGRRVKK
jgi:hypothetical protein